MPIHPVLWRRRQRRLDGAAPAGGMTVDTVERAELHRASGRRQHGGSTVGGVPAPE